MGGGWALAPSLAAHLRHRPKAPAWYLPPEDRPDEWLGLLRAMQVVAASRRGALALRSAALHHGWPVLDAPTTTEVAVPQGRKFRALPGVHGPVTMVRRSLRASELADRVTDPVRTVLDCAATLPFRDALAIADSALRTGDVGALELSEAAARAQRGRAAAVRVAEAATALAANPFESAMRAMALEVEGARFVPQQEVVTPVGRAWVDLGDPELRVALEADSYTFHGSTDGFVRDIRRYNVLATLDWAVIRVGFGDLMKHPGAIKEQVQAVVWGRRSSR